jgi:hypothetical protein
MPGAGDSERDAEFREYSGQSAAEAIEMPRRARIKIIGKAELVLRMVQRPIVVQ